MKTRVIKRYKNRRLYDTSEKKTIKLKDVANLVKQDVSFKVIDNKTGKDVTYLSCLRFFRKHYLRTKRISKKLPN